MKVKITKTRLSIISIAIILVSFILSQDWSPQTTQDPNPTYTALPTPTESPTPTPEGTNIPIPIATGEGSPLIPLELKK